MTNQPTDNQNMPLFYQAPVPLAPERHGKLSIVRSANFSFSQKTNSIPLTAPEFSMASKFYPIVFAGDEKPVAFGLVGIRDNENLMVDGEGKWQPDTYIPTYVMRYPFIFMENENDNRLVLCVDEKASAVQESGENPFFKDNEPTELSKQALKVCTDYHKHITLTEQFTAELKKYDLLKGHYAEFNMNSGQKFNLGGFQVIDEEKFNELPDDVVLDWHKKGFMFLIHAHFMSMSNWQRLINATADRLMEDKPAQ